MALFMALGLLGNDSSTSSLYNNDGVELSLHRGGGGGHFRGIDPMKHWFYGALIPRSIDPYGVSS